uniref:PPM-type phosphatase domain-containing protein n=1 Tax=Aureoumbra lagunensis TaxID=44058 RepID=A0A7S3JYV0_9STRA
MGAEHSAPERSTSSPKGALVSPDPSEKNQINSKSKIIKTAEPVSSRRFSLSSLRKQSTQRLAETSKTEIAKTFVWGVTAREGCGLVQSKNCQSATWVKAWAASVAPAKADMDRFAFCLRNGIKENRTIISAAVCDGHGISRQHNWGDQIATRTVKRLVQECAYFPEEASIQISDKSHSIMPSSIMPKVFERLQTQHESIYKKEILEPFEKARKAFEEEHGFSAGPCTLPCEGGTTACVFRLEGPELSFAWVGDSRAVLAVRSNPHQFHAIPLTNDHNVERNQNEQKRCEDAGGQVLGRFLGAGDADGMLQVTRSIGDTAHHASNIVLATPETITRKLTENDAFIVMASDGVWDFLDNQTVVDTIVEYLQQIDPTVLSPALIESTRSHATEEYKLQQENSKDEHASSAVVPIEDATNTLASSSSSSSSGKKPRRKSVPTPFQVPSLRRLSAPSTVHLNNEHVHLQAAAKAVVDRVLTTAAESKSKPDDTMCLIVLLSPPLNTSSSRTLTPSSSSSSNTNSVPLPVG